MTKPVTSRHHQRVITRLGGEENVVVSGGWTKDEVSTTRTGEHCSGSGSGSLGKSLESSRTCIVTAIASGWVMFRIHLFARPERVVVLKWVDGWLSGWLGGLLGWPTKAPHTTEPIRQLDWLDLHPWAPAFERCQLRWGSCQMLNAKWVVLGGSRWL